MDEYYKEIAMTLMRANIEEETEDTMAHFMNGLNPNVRDVVELQEYVEFDDLLHKVVWVDTKVVHDGFTNKISFQHHDQKIILKPISPREVCDDCRNLPFSGKVTQDSRMCLPIKKNAGESPPTFILGKR